MNLRKKITGIVALIALAGILGTLLVATRAFVDDKRDYVMELSAAAAPNIAASVARHLDGIEAQLVAFDELLKVNLGSPRLGGILQARFEKMRSVVALEVHDESGLLLKVARERVTEIPDAELRQWMTGASRKLVLKVGAIALVTFQKGHLYVATLKRQEIADLLEPARALSVSLRLAEGTELFGVAGPDSVAIPVPAAREILSPMLSQSAQSVLVREIRLSEDSNVIVAVALVPDTTGLAVVTSVAESQVFKIARQIVRKVVPVTGLVLLLAIGIGIGLSAIIVRPIEALTEATARIATGDWKVHLKPQGTDEIAQLAKAFSRMGAELESREAALKEAHEDLLKSEQLATLGRFGAGLAHEVKNPLNSIQGFAQLLQRRAEGKLEEEERKFLGIIVDETRRATRIISDLLVFAKQRVPRRADADIREIVARAFQLFEPIAVKEGLLLENLPCDQPLRCSVDQEQFLQVLQNLMTNASHALQEKPQGAERRLGLKTERRDAEAVVSVIDNGIGISDANMKKLFQPFFSTKGVGKGTGLGLATCHGIVHQHGGRITVSSKLGEGTEFRIYLPAMDV